MKRTVTIIALGAAAAAAAWFYINPEIETPTGPWTAAERSLLASLSIDHLGPPPSVPSNAVADDDRAATLGHRLFFDTRFSSNSAVSCASCHQPDRRFTDGLTKGVGVGIANRHTPSIVGAAYSPWQYWDGRRDSLWSQALSPIEDHNEHGANRMQVVRIVAKDPTYRSIYTSLFGPLPAMNDTARFPEHASPIGSEPWVTAWRSMAPADQDLINHAFANIGKAIAAYERLLVPGRSRFDDYIDAIAADDEQAQEALFTDDERAGLRLFLGPARCTECHNGPLLTNHEFHNTGVLAVSGEVPDRGRAQGLRELEAHPFNCLSDFSDDPLNQCAELRFVRRGKELVGAFRTPSLRNLGGTAPFHHRGQTATLGEVLEHYNEGPDAMIGHNEAEPLGLTRRQLQQLEAFLGTLDAPLDVEPRWLEAPAQ